MFYIPAGLAAGFYASMVISFWLAVRKFGKLHVAYRRESQVFNLDVIGVAWALMVPFWAAYDVLGLRLPLMPPEAFASWQCVLYAVVAAIAALAMGYFNGRERFTSPTHAGLAESALRFLAARQIITAAEVAHVLRTVPLPVVRGNEK